MKQLKLSRCALCGSDDKLELSHIIPKMVIRNLKKTAISNIRSVENPNKPIQDSEKHYMLCGKCEDLFSEYEKYFSDNIFQPYLKKEKVSYDYDRRLFYFLTSLSWRSLYMDLLDFVANDVVGIDALECLISSEKIMSEYLLNKRNDIGCIEHHIFFFDRIDSTGGNNGFNTSDFRPHVTFHRGEFSYTICNENNHTYLTFTNMMGLMVITFYSKGEEEYWDNTQITNGNGVIEARNQKMQSIVCNEMIYIMENTKNVTSTMSNIQQEKIKERIEKEKDKISSYAIYQDWIDDMRIEDKR